MQSLRKLRLLNYLLRRSVVPRSRRLISTSKWGGPANIHTALFWSASTAVLLYPSPKERKEEKEEEEGNPWFHCNACRIVMTKYQRDPLIASYPLQQKNKLNSPGAAPQFYRCLLCCPQRDCHLPCMLRDFSVCLCNCYDWASTHRCFWSPSQERYSQKMRDGLSNSSQSTCYRTISVCIYPVLWNVYPSALSPLTDPSKDFKPSVSSYWRGNAKETLCAQRGRASKGDSTLRVAGSCAFVMVLYFLWIYQLQTYTLTLTSLPTHAHTHPHIYSSTLLYQMD